MIAGHHPAQGFFSLDAFPVLFAEPLLVSVPELKNCDSTE